jgi:hypothetical protein
MWLFFHTHYFSGQETYAIAENEVITTKSGKKTGRKVSRTLLTQISN